jgi:catalase
MLIQDTRFLEMLAYFDREVIPERRMHAKGPSAFGTFSVTKDITQCTKVKIFSEVGKKTEMFVRFYTEEGDWELVGNDAPVFFLRDPLKFPDLNHAVKRDPRTSLRSAKNERFWGKFHLECQQGIKNLIDAEDEAIIAKDRESHQRDLYDAIERKDHPRWKMPCNPFDITKVRYHKDYSLVEAGVFELNENPENYFADAEQAASFPTETPSAIVSARTITRYRSTLPAVPIIAIIATGQCGSTATTARLSATSRTATASGRRNPARRNRRSLSMARRIIGIPARTTPITTPNRASFSGS